MAPQKGQSKPAKAATGHANAKKQQQSQQPAPAAPRHVVLPVIPLTMVAKQRGSIANNTTSANSSKHSAIASATATATASPTTPNSNRTPFSSLEAALIDHIPDKSAKASAQNGNGNEVNGSAVEKPGPAATTGADNHVRQSHDTPVQTNGVNGVDSEAPRDLPTAAAAETAQLSCAPSVADAESTAGSASANDTSQGAHDGHSLASQPQSATTQSRGHDLPPSFHNPPIHPLQQQQSVDQFSDTTNFHAPHHMHPHHHQQHAHHQHHMSNGGPAIMFGAFAGSHSSSPAPPSGGFMPPPPPPPVNGDAHIHPRANGHHHAHSSSNGFPAHVNTHFRPDIMPMTTLDTYGQVSAHGPPVPFESFPPGVGRYGPPTPRSFHGSHTSGEPNGMENGSVPFPPNGSSGVHYPGPAHRGHTAAYPHPHPPASFPPYMHPEDFSRRPSMATEEMTESMVYIRNQFDNNELSDCVLELVYAKGRNHGLKINGHKLILARSPALKQHIMVARATDSGSHTITIECDDSYLRNDAWWMAVQRLYLHPLLLHPPMMGNPGNVMALAGDMADRLGFCLGYAAAGHILGMQDVLERGLYVAAEQLDWTTIEEAIAFVREGTTQRHYKYPTEQDGPHSHSVTLDFGYGPETKILWHAILNFLVNEFPPNFDLDTSVTDPPKLARIPADAAGAAPSPLPTHPDKIMPAIARGTMTRNNSKPSRLSSIKFGDLPPTLPDDGSTPQRETAKCSPILSRVLLNLHFDELCEVLTSGSHGVRGWNSAQDRYHVVADVVAEREARRLRAVDAVRSGSVPQAREVQQRLSAQRRHAMADPWDVLNWREEVNPPRNAGVPRLVRNWVPQFNVPPEPLQQFQQTKQPSYEAHDSMV
ncbi:Uu.00g120570.m01.CDS01 [Anthostomella pinea]|uniref:Uu.00g120570.m01.CDS01 n=1 Tax=Anthostomella pinea TaxID=933095 RepID=A0AAI8YET9_9PEZI|nr:Uu.00g120570.m01.CDS01 [Anthostomella pinea]